VDTKQITEWAKEFTLEEGGHNPMLMLFVLGFHYPKRSNREITQMMQDMLGPT